MYPVVFVSTAEELFYKTRSTSTGIPTLLCVLILQRSSSTRLGAPVEGYRWEYIYPVVCGNTGDELFDKTRRTSASISTLLCVSVLQRSSSTRPGAPVGVHLPVVCVNTA